MKTKILSKFIATVYTEIFKVFYCQPFGEGVTEAPQG